MRHSHNRYRAPTRGLRPTYQPAIFGPARPGNVPGHVIFLVLTVMCVFFLCLFLWMSVCISAQLITPSPSEYPVSDPNSHLGNGLLCVGWPRTDVLNNCLSCLFGERTSHNPGLCRLGCPLSAVNAECGDHLKTSPFQFRLQDTLLHLSMWSPHTVPVAHKGTSGQTHFCLPVTSYNQTFNDVIEKTTEVLEFILCQATLAAFDLFHHLALIVHDRLPHSTKRWRGRKARSSSGHRRCPHQKTCDVLCTLACRLSTLTIVCISGGMRYKCQAVSKQLRSLLVKFPSLELRRGLKCARRVRGHLVMSFTIPRSCVTHIRFKDSSSCLAFTRQLALLVRMLSPVVSLHPYFFLRALLLLAGDVEANPGPIQVSEVLEKYEDTFFEVVNPKYNLLKLKRKGVITQDIERRISATNDDEGKEILYDHLKHHGSEDTLREFCKVAIAADGYPNMQKLAEKLMKELSQRGHDGVSLRSVDEEVQSFFSRMKEYYSSMHIVEDEWFPNQTMCYVNLALANFRLGSQHAHEMFVQAVTEGVDNVYTYQTGKVECDAIPQLVKEHTLVILSGAPGVGKSTLARKVCQDVCCSPGCHGYSLILLVELRKLLHFKKSFKLMDILQLFQGMIGDTTSPEVLSKAIHRNLGRGVLLILDGFDELPPHLRQSDFLVNLLSRNLECSAPLPYCHVVMTSRSIVTNEIYCNVRVGLTNIEVLGFSQDQIKEYAKHLFTDQGLLQLLDSFISKIDSVPQIKGLCSIPVVLSIICQVFLYEKNLPPTLTQIYNDYLCVKVLKYSEDLPALDSILKLPTDHDIYKLGEIAYNCIESQKVVFDSADLHGLGECFSDRKRGCGVLTARPIQCGPKSKKGAIESFFFIHLTVQEFLAAVFVSLLTVDRQRKVWARYLSEPHMAQVWRFYCGLTKLQQFDLLQMNSYSEDFQMQCLFEAQNDSLVRQLMPRFVGEKVKLQPKTAYDSTAYGYCLSCNSSLRELTVIIGDHTFAQIGRLLEPVLSSQQLHTLRIMGPIIGSKEWREVEDLLDRIASQTSGSHDGTLKVHFGMVCLARPPLSTAVRLLCLQHVTEILCVYILTCEAVDHEILMKMERSLSGNKTMNKLTLSDHSLPLSKQFCRHLLLGIKRNSSLSDADLSFKPQNWDCPDDVPAGDQGSIQHLILRRIPVDVLANMITLFSTIKELECQDIHPPQEDGVSEEELKLNEMEQALAGMSGLEKVVLGMYTDVPDSLMLKFGIPILKVISKKNSIGIFALYDCGKREELPTEMLTRLTPDENSRFSIGQYTNFGGHTYPCIHLSPSTVAVNYPNNMMQTPGMMVPWLVPLAPQGLVLHYSSDAPGLSRISAPAPPPAPPTELGTHFISSDSPDPSGIGTAPPPPAPPYPSEAVPTPPLVGHHSHVVGRTKALPSTPLPPYPSVQLQ